MLYYGLKVITMSKTWIGGHEISVVKYLGRLEEDKLKAEEACWEPIEAARNIPDPTNVEDEVLSKITSGTIEAVVQDSFKALTKREGEVTEMCFVGGITQGEAARKLGISRQAVSSYVANARFKLSLRLRGRGIEAE